MKRIAKIGKVSVFVMALLIIAALIYAVLPTKADPVDQYHSSWKLIRETNDEDGATFAAVYDLTLESNFANKDSSTVANGGPYQIRSYRGSGDGTEFQSSGEKWMFALCAKNYDVGADNTIDNTFSFDIIGWSRTNGMLQVIAEGDCVLGTQAVVTYPDDSADAVGVLVDESNVTYTHSSETFTVTNAAFDDVVAGMMVYVTSDDDSNLTTGYYAVTTATDSNDFVCSGITSSGDTTARVQMNPSFWVDTINLDETTKWPSRGVSGDANGVMVYNSGDNEVAVIVVETTGLEWIQFVIYDAKPAQTGEAGDVTVYGRLF